MSTKDEHERERHTAGGDGVSRLDLFSKDLSRTNPSFRYDQLPSQVAVLYGRGRKGVDSSLTSCLISDWLQLLRGASGRIGMLIVLGDIGVERRIGPWRCARSDDAGLRMSPGKGGKAPFIGPNLTTWENVDSRDQQMVEPSTPDFWCLLPSS